MAAASELGASNPRRPAGVTVGVTVGQSKPARASQPSDTLTLAQEGTQDRASNALAPRLLSVKAAAGYLSVSPWLVRRLLEAGALHAVTLAGCRRVLIDRLELDAMVSASRIA